LGIENQRLLVTNTTNIPTAKNRSKRQRKKMYVDEFSVIGFGFQGRFNADSDEQLDPFFDGLVELLNTRDLMISGGNNEDFFEAYLSSNDRYGSATEEDRTAVTEWLNAQKRISDVVVAELSDAYYGE
jgi:uncharacterized protein YggL (DUF469 family)